MAAELMWFDRATAVIPGGVNSPVRSFRSVGGTPEFIKRGSGSRIYTESGRELIDFCGSWGALLFGHAHPAIVAAVQQAAQAGTSFGAATSAEVSFAEQLCAMVDGVDQVRAVNSGTEAVMTAVRLARGYTGRSRIVKFDGCYHGHSDALLVAAGSGMLAGARSSSAGVPAGTVADTRVVPFNDLAALECLMASEGDGVAAILIEPVAANMGLVPPRTGFLEGVKTLADQYGALLIFDEVISGFRFGSSSYGALSGIAADITCFGKIVGGGVPLAVVGASREIMQHLAPCGDVYQAGTLSGNPLAVAAGRAMLSLIQSKSPYLQIEQRAVELDALVPLLSSQAMCLQRKGGAFTFFFADTPPCNLAEVQASAHSRYGAFFHAMLDRGIYLPPSPYETAFLSTAHTADDVELLIDAIHDYLEQA